MWIVITTNKVSRWFGLWADVLSFWWRRLKIWYKKFCHILCFTFAGRVQDSRPKATFKSEAKIMNSLFARLMLQHRKNILLILFAFHVQDLWLNLINNKNTDHNIANGDKRRWKNLSLFFPLLLLYDMNELWKWRRRMSWIKTRNGLWLLNQSDGKLLIACNVHVWIKNAIDAWEIHKLACDYFSLSLSLFVFRVLLKASTNFTSLCFGILST